MKLFKSLNIKTNILFIRSKHGFVIKENVSDFFDTSNKYGKHPGSRKGFDRNLPYKLVLAATTVINRHRNKNFRTNIKKVNDDYLKVFIHNIQNYEENQNYSSWKKINVEKSFDFQSYNKNKEEIKAQERERSHYYKKDLYNNYQCACYMAARLPANYAILSRIFHEIRIEEPDFTPTSVFDFGSGVGTTIWVADEYWKSSIREYFCVDINENMHQLSRELLQKGTNNNENILNNVFYRHFLPAKHVPTYDLVVSAFSLLEMENTRSRLHVVENLWQKTSGVLVLVEQGSKAGFTAIMEARNFLLRISNAQIDQPTKSDSTELTDRLTKVGGSVLAPCSHDFACPRQTTVNKKEFCNFKISFNQLDYGQLNPGINTEKYTFVVMKKNGHFKWKEEQKNWGKIIAPVIKRSGHSICRICDNDGYLKEVIISKSKEPLHLFRCIKRCKWGDRVPADTIEIPTKSEVNKNK